MLREQPLARDAGIGHTRWATHGRPSEQNAHPHRAGKVVVIHNGIIENYLELRHALAKRGPHLGVGDRHRGHRASHRRVRGAGLRPGRGHATGDRASCAGSFAIVVLSESEPDRLVAAKSATPIVLGLGDGENFIASDIPAMLDHTRHVLFLEDGEVAEVTADEVAHHQPFDGTPVERAAQGGHLGRGDRRRRAATSTSC